MPIPRFYLQQNVFDAALERIGTLYAKGYRVIVSFSGGKDSGVCTELAIIAAKHYDRLPVEVVMRDDEIMFPGTFEYSLRLANRPEVKFHWIVQNQPVINMFNRVSPYFWCFDPLLDPEEWVRKPPEWATYMKHMHIEAILHPDYFPPPKDHQVVTLIGMRTQESQRRRRGLYSSGGYLTGANRYGVVNARPIYDWTDGDVWKAHNDYGWDYNSAYDIMHRLGVSRTQLRIAPPTQTSASIAALWVAARAWPKWFDKVCERLPGIRSAAMYGKRVVEPERGLGESWEDVFNRECVGAKTPEWIRARSQAVIDEITYRHARHSSTPYPDMRECGKCGEQVGSWKRIARMMYMGDPFCMKQSMVPNVEPEFFREGGGTWGGGRPSW